MSHIIDSYDESNYDGDGSPVIEAGQSFTGDGSVLDSVSFYLGKIGSPTGNAVAKIYAHSGTYGTSSVPTGAALATSDNVDVSGIPSGTEWVNSTEWVNFTFSGDDKITLTNSTYYVVTFFPPEYVVDNEISIGADISSPTHSGNFCNYDGGWTGYGVYDLCFYVYGDLDESLHGIIGGGIIPFIN